MAFLTSLLTYLGSVAGVLFACTMTYTLVFATPDQLPPAPKMAVSAAAPNTQLNTYMAPAGATNVAPSARLGQWGPAVVHPAAEGATPPQARIVTAAPHKPVTHVAARKQPMDLRNFRTLLAYQPMPNANGALGYADEAAARSR